MPSMNRRNWLSASGVGLRAGGAPALTSAEGAGAHAVSPARARIQQRFFPNLPLVTHEGKEVLFYDDLIKDKIVLLNMMYAKCDGICMPTTMNLVKVQKLLRERYGARFGREIVMYSLTLKPEQDSPEALKNYAVAHGAGPGWLFLTGRPDDMEQLRRKLGYVDLDPQIDKTKLSHTGNVRYGNEARTIWSACPGLSKPDAIAEVISWVDWPQAAPATAAKGGQK
ncbi:MAG: SCO family protein [Pyrinomonadaceae bacterium]